MSQSLSMDTHNPLLCCVCAPQGLLQVFAGMQTITCLHFSVCSCVGRCLGLSVYLCLCLWIQQSAITRNVLEPQLL